MSAYVPEYLPASMHEQFSQLATDLQRVGYSDVDAPLLVKYLLAESEYRRITNKVTDALNRGDSDSAAKWLSAQDKLTTQTLKLSDALNMSPKARLVHGVPWPGTKSGGVRIESRRQIQAAAH